MDALRQSILRAQLAKPLPGGGTQPGRPQNSAGTRASDMAAIDARFSALDKRLDALILMLRSPSQRHDVSRHLLPADIRRAVADFFGVTEQDIVRAGRRARIARIRQIAYYLCRTHTTRWLPAIGRNFGGRDHTTILHGVRRIGALRQTDAALDSDLSQLEARLADVRARRNAVDASTHAGT
jgi:chromosomal replication initiator protein